MGLSIAATYICWDFHEIAPGHYDFHGTTDPRRNLIAFLDLVAAEGLWLIIRPGPYIYGEWRNGGVPDHAVVHHRLSAEFQEKALPYLRAITSLLIPYLASRGGRIVLVQADNEIDSWPQWTSERIGLGSTAGVFQDFLQARYGTIDGLNQAWQTSYADFSTARATSVALAQTSGAKARVLDTRRFRLWYADQVACWSVKTYQDLGIDVPIVLNTYSGVGAQSFADFEQIADLVGADFYPSREFALRPQEYRSFMDSARVLAAYSRLPYIAELGAGIWHDWLTEVGILTPNHYRLVCLSALLCGVVGWNWYMLVNRDNWAMAPINEQGRSHPDLFEVFQQTTALFKAIDPPALAHQVNTAITFDPLHVAGLTSDLLRAFYEAGIDHAFYDPDVGTCRQPLLFYASTTPLSAGAAASLEQYVRDGGHLILFADKLPQVADHFTGKALDPNFFSLVEPIGVVDSSASRLSLRFGSSERTWTVDSPWLAYYTPESGQPIEAEQIARPAIGMEEDQLRTGLQNGLHYRIGTTRSLDKGAITTIGLSPSAELLIALHNELCPAALPVVRSITPDTAAAWFIGLFEGQPVAYLIVTNNGEESKAVELHLQPSGRYVAHDLMRGGTVQIDTESPVFIPLPRKDGTVLRLIPRL